MTQFDLRWCVREGQTPCSTLVRSTDPALPSSAVEPLRELEAHARDAAAFFADLGLGDSTAHPDLLLIANLAEPNARSITSADELGGCDGALRDSSLCQGQGAILFGVRARQLCTDADVVTHELSHVWMRPMLGERRWLLDAAGTSNDPALIKEGLADFHAALKTGDPLWGEHSALPTEAARSLRVKVSFPEARTGFAHADSLALSSALWEVHSHAKARFVQGLTRYLVQTSSPPTALAPWARGLAVELEKQDPALAATWLRTAGRHGLLLEERVLDLRVGEMTRAASDAFLVPGRRDVPEASVPRSVLQFRGDSPTEGKALLALRAGPHAEQDLEVVIRPGTPVDEATALGARTRFTQVGGRLEASLELPRGPYYVQLTHRGEAATWVDDLSIRLVESPAPSTPPAPSLLAVSVGLLAASTFALAALRWRRGKRAATARPRQGA
ncbi:hypothetical protein [Myxococcus landrumensis]|uniref:hypothetical protein n=1 Tax=Myxococcus landrumensis TaxID=2813577 RepID=UPI001F50E03B|nr:hypothetical protein [Myxococcus landrumus]